MKKNQIIFYINLLLFFSCGSGCSEKSYIVKKNLRTKYKENFIILSEKAMPRYQGRNTEKTCIKIVSFESPDYIQYKYTVCPKKNQDLVFHAWYSTHNNGTNGDNYYDAKLEYQVKKYVYSILSKKDIPPEFVTCYVTITNTKRLILYKKNSLNITDIIKIENKLPEKDLNISINFDLRKFSVIKNEYKEAIIKLCSKTIKTDEKNYTWINISYNYNKEHKYYNSININLSHVKSEREVRNHIEKKIKFWERCNKKK